MACGYCSKKKEEKQGMGEDKDWSYIVENRKVREKGREGREGREKLRMKRKAGRWRARQGEGGLHMTSFTLFPSRLGPSERGCYDVLWWALYRNVKENKSVETCFFLFLCYLINLNKGQVTHLFMQTLWNSSGKRQTMRYLLCYRIVFYKFTLSKCKNCFYCYSRLNILFIQYIHTTFSKSIFCQKIVTT